MNRIIKLYRITSYLAAFLYISLGLLIIGSIVKGTSELYIHLIIGTLCTIIGGYLYSKAKNVIRLIINIKGLCKENQTTSSITERFLLFESLFIMLSILSGIILLSGVISRVIGEDLPVFG